MIKSKSKRKSRTRFGSLNLTPSLASFVGNEVFTPKALHNTAQGRVSAPWEKKRDRFAYPEGVAQSKFRPLVQPLRGR